MSRIHIFGASGSGTTTLGRELSRKLGIAQFDADDYYWLPTDPPYQQNRTIIERQEIMSRDINKVDSWIISGSFCGWGDIFIPLFDLVVYLWVPTEIRLQRLEKRQLERFGQRMMQPGGEMHETHQDFIRWASRYDKGGPDMRSRVRHRRWMEKLSCPLLCIEGEKSLPEILAEIDQMIIQLRVEK